MGPCIASTAFVFAGLLPQMPRPHVDLHFHFNALFLLGFFLAGKTATLAFHLRPANDRRPGVELHHAHNM